MSFFQELKRRNVFRVGIAYVVLGWMLLQVTDVVAPILELPDWVAKFVFFVLIIGFPLILLFAWAFEMTPEGLRREKDVDRESSITSQTGKKLDRAIIGILAIAVVFLVVDRFRTETPVEPAAETVAADTATLPAAVEKSVAVLPFLALSAGDNDEYFADGLTEEILNSLAQLPELLVTARTSAFAFKGRDLPIEEIAATLGVEHVVEGSVRRAGERLRVTAQLIRADDGFHIWSQNYDRNSDDTIAVQEDIAEHIAEALDVVLDQDKRELMQQAGLRDVVAFTEYQKARDLYERAHGELNQMRLLSEANEHLDRVIERVPDYGPAYIERSDLYVHALYNQSMGQPPEDLELAILPTALEQVTRDYQAGIRYARNAEERRLWEADLALLSGNWRGLDARTLQAIAIDSCFSANWLSIMVTLDRDIAAAYLDYAKPLLSCDPLSSTNWFMATRAAMWAGNFDEALEIGREGMETAPGQWLQHVLATLYATRGDIDTAKAITPDGADTVLTQIMLAAARGDADTARQLAADNPFESTDDSQLEFLASVWSGDREAANRQAARIDQHPLGHAALTSLIAWCSCGAPFDIESTPNFAAKLDAAGFSWPPQTVIDFPLKEW